MTCQKESTVNNCIFIQIRDLKSDIHEEYTIRGRE